MSRLFSHLSLPRPRLRGCVLACDECAVRVGSLGFFTWVWDCSHSVRYNTDRRHELELQLLVLAVGIGNGVGTRESGATVEGVRVIGEGERGAWIKITKACLPAMLPAWDTAPQRHAQRSSRLTRALRIHWRRTHYGRRGDRVLFMLSLSDAEVIAEFESAGRVRQPWRHQP